MISITIVIPCFNEKFSLELLFKRITTSRSLKNICEVICIDDGSTDTTPQILKQLQKKYPSLHISILCHKKNKGKGASLKLGIIKSKGDYVIIQDADLEYDPQEYDILLEPLIHLQADAVYGSRFGSAKPHRVLYFSHYIANRTLTTISNIFTGLNLTDMETGFKAFRGDLIRSLAPLLQSNDFGFEPEITALLAKKKKLRIFEVGISYNGRTYEEGKKIQLIDGIRALWYIIKYNIKH
ncbi:MAG: glycosyltransferase family 2 protein [Candidatus Roizmanbacteria bacterium]